MSGRLLSVNVALPSDVVLAGRTRRTGILKRPTDEPVRVGELGLAGDGVASDEHHGGPDQAVYAFCQEDYDWWSGALGRELAPATFGENLTIAGIGSSAELRIGDRFEVGDAAVFEVTSPRIPCDKLAGRMDDSGFARRFARAERPGAYLRVLEKGTLRVGDAVRLAPADGAPLTLIEAMRLFYDRAAGREQLERALAAPVSIRTRELLARRLAALA